MLRSFPKRTTNKNNQGKKVKRRTKQSIIATDNNGEQIFATTSKPKKKKRSQQAVVDDDENRSSNEKIEKVLVKLDDSDDSYNEEFESEGGEVNIVELGKDKQAAEGDHVLVEYKTASAAVVYYVAKVLDVQGSKFISISCLRRVMTATEKNKFAMPVVLDINEVSLDQLRYKLPRPASHRSTQRQLSVYEYDCFFSNEHRY